MPIYNRSRTRRKCSRTAFRRRCGVALSTGFGCEEFLAVLVGISAFRRSFGYGNLQLEVLSMELDTPNVRLVSECRCRRGVGTLRFRGFGIPRGDCGFLCFRMSFQECSRIIGSGLPAYCRSGDRRRTRRILQTGILEFRIGGQIPFLIVRSKYEIHTMFVDSIFGMRILLDEIYGTGTCRFVDRAHTRNAGQSAGHCVGTRRYRAFHQHGDLGV